MYKLQNTHLKKKDNYKTHSYRNHWLEYQLFLINNIFMQEKTNMCHGILLLMIVFCHFSLNYGKGLL